MTIEDINWEGGRLRLRSKCKRFDELPLPADVGEAITERLGPASGRSTQSRASGRGSRRGSVDDSRHEVWQVSTRTFACLNLQGTCRLHRAPQTLLGATAGLTLPVRLRTGQSFGCRRHSSNFLCAIPTVRLRGESASHGPRLHDMRHVFATNTLVCWYKSGEDPARRLPILSAYLGHVHVEDTQWYLSGSPELMRQAMRRLERRWGGRP